MSAHPSHTNPDRTEPSLMATAGSQQSAKDEATSTAVEPKISPSSDPHPRHGSHDVEEQRPPRYTSENDPYQLSSAYKSPKDLELIRANTSRKRSCNPNPFGKTNTKARHIKKFYENQNENIERLLKPVDDHVADAKQLDADNHLKFQIAVYGSFAANLILAGLQLYGAISSGSLSLFTTMADAVFDPLSNVTLIVTNRAMKRVDARKFPSGKARIETSGNIMFCFVMTAVSFILIAFSIQELVGTPKNDPFHLASVIAVAIAFCTKLCLFFYCWTMKNTYSQINILWHDHRNDLFINGFGLLTSIGGSRLVWWIDPMGAILLSLLVSGIWLHTAYEENLLLVGVTASPEMQQLITYVAVTHDPMIKAIDTATVYHSGPRLIVEVDVVMDAEETLQTTHDVAEALQMKLESLPDVERAYVHVDYETTHKPEHGFKKDL